MMKKYNDKLPQVKKGHCLFQQQVQEKVYGMDDDIIDVVCLQQYNYYTDLSNRREDIK